MPSRSYDKSSRSKPKWTKRRIWLIVLAGLVLFGVPLVYSALQARRAEGLYARWIEYEPPRNMVVYEEDRAAAAQLLASGGGYFAMTGAEDENPVAFFPPNAN